MSWLKGYSIVFFCVYLLNTGFCQTNQISNNSNQKRIKSEGKQIEFEVKEKNVSKKKLFSEQKAYFWYKSQAIIITKGAASGHLLHGRYEVFYDNNQFAERGKFINGLKHGKWNYWDSSGNLVGTEKWFFGKISSNNKKDKNEPAE